MVFLRSDGPLPSTGPAILTLVVANADGTQPRALTPPTTALDWFDWSPDGASIAYMSRGGLYVVDVDVDAAQPRQVKDTGTMHFPTWLPPDGKDIVYRLEIGEPRDLRHRGRWHRRATPAVDDPCQQRIRLPGDRRLAGRFARHLHALVRSRPPARLRAERRDRKGHRLPDVGRGWSARDGDLFSRRKAGGLCPDLCSGGFQLVVADADGSGNERTIGQRKPGPAGGTDVDASWAFTPDGTALMVRYGDDAAGRTHLMPIDGSAPTDLGSGEFEFVDIQRLAP